MQSQTHKLFIVSTMLKPLCHQAWKPPSDYRTFKFSKQTYKQIDLGLGLADGRTPITGVAMTTLIITMVTAAVDTAKFMSI